MISRESILRYIPANLHPKQALFLDGIRHAADITTFAYERLRCTLTEIAFAEISHAAGGLVDLRQEVRDLRYTAAFLDAWSIVDAVDRFRALWSLFPLATLNSTAPGEKTFLEQFQPVRDLRNVADHLAQRADYVLARQGTALGVLSWATSHVATGKIGYSCMIVPGRIQKSSHEIVNPAGQTFDLPTGLVHLSAGEYRVNLSEIFSIMAIRIRELEGLVESWLRGLDTVPAKGGADMLSMIWVRISD